MQNSSLFRYFVFIYTTLLTTPIFGVDFSLFSLVSTSKLEIQSALGVTMEIDGEPGYGGGVLIEMYSFKNIGLEIGAIYHPRTLTMESHYEPEPGKNSFSYKTATLTQLIEIPILLRYHFNRFSSLGGGIYYDRFIGKIKTESSSEKVIAGVKTVSENNQDRSYQDAGQSLFDYGCVLSLRFMAPWGKQYTGLFLDFRYNKGLKNQIIIEDAASEVDLALTKDLSMLFNDYQILVGLKF